MKRVLCLLLALALLSGLCACGSRAGNEDGEPQQSSRRVRRTEGREAAGVSETGEKPASETEPTPVPTPEPTPEPTPDPYYQELLDAIAAYDPKIVLPETSALIAPDKLPTKYIQGEFGQGVGLFVAPTERDRLGIIEEGVSVTVLCMREGRALVRVSDGRYGWAPMDRLADSFDAQLSYTRKKNYLIASPEEWALPYWRAFILEHQDDLPAEIVAAAKAANG